MGLHLLQTDFSGLILLRPDVFRDQRGYFTEIHKKSEFKDLVGDDIDFVQDNLSYSRINVIRGLHFQATPYSQTKLVRCVWGAIQDVAVDIRPESDSFGSYFSIELSADNMLQLLVPKGFAHGFAVLSEGAVVEYKCDSYYMPSHDSGIRWNDEYLGIKWMIDHGTEIVSDKDKSLLTFNEVLERRLI